MDAIAIMTPQHVTTSPALSDNLILDFVSWIDRSERTTRNYLTNLRQFMTWLRFSTISSPTRQDVISYREWLRSEHDAIAIDAEAVTGWSYRRDAGGNILRVSCKPATVKLYLQSVRQFFSWTAANGLYPDIASNIHAPTVAEAHKKDSLTPEEVRAIETSIGLRTEARASAAQSSIKDRDGKVQRVGEQGARLYAMYLLAVNAGLRTVEISRANVRDIETKGGRTWFYIWGKGRSEADQKKPLAPEVKDAIDAYLQTRTDHPTGSSPLFVSTGNRSGGKRIAPTTISTMLKRAMQDAGFNSERLTAHSLRHTTAQNVLELTGNNIYSTQQYMRHSSPKTTEIYLENEHGEQDDLIARQLYRRFHGEADPENDELLRLEDATARLTPDQLKHLAEIAAAMAG